MNTLIHKEFFERVEIVAAQFADTFEDMLEVEFTFSVAKKFDYIHIEVKDVNLL